MNNSTTQKNYFAHLQLAGFITAMICLLAANSPSFAADSEYLRSLESESNNSGASTIDTPGSGNNYLDALSDEAEASAKLTTSDQHDDAYYKNLEKMETLLESKKPSTYKFYKKLSPKKQADIFEQYAADKSNSDSRLSHLQKQVMDSYFKR